MLKARDIMTENVINVKGDMPIYEALELFEKHNISGVPVVEDDMTLIGILSERDVLRLFHSSNDTESETVNDYMTRPAVHFDEEESLSDVCGCLTDNYFRRVPVTSEGKLVGIVSRKDIIREILRTRSQSIFVDKEAGS